LVATALSYSRIDEADEVTPRPELPA